MYQIAVSCTTQLLLTASLSLLRKEEWGREGTRTKKGGCRRCHPQSMFDLLILTKYN